MVFYQGLDSRYSRPFGERHVLHALSRYGITCEFGERDNEDYDNCDLYELIHDEMEPEYYRMPVCEDIWSFDFLLGPVQHVRQAYEEVHKWVPAYSVQ